MEGQPLVIYQERVTSRLDVVVQDPVSERYGPDCAVDCSSEFFDRYSEGLNGVEQPDERNGDLLALLPLRVCSRCRIEALFKQDPTGQMKKRQKSISDEKGRRDRRKVAFPGSALGSISAPGRHGIASHLSMRYRFAVELSRHKPLRMDETH